jgi:hypothetical protein
MDGSPEFDRGLAGQVRHRIEADQVRGRVLSKLVFFTQAKSHTRRTFCYKRLLQSREFKPSKIAGKKISMSTTQRGIMLFIPN